MSTLPGSSRYLRFDGASAGLSASIFDLDVYGGWVALHAAAHAAEVSYEIVVADGGAAQRNGGRLIAGADQLELVVRGYPHIYRHGGRPDQQARGDALSGGGQQAMSPCW